MTEPLAGGGTRQTRTYLMELLSAHGLRPRRQLGQCFLIDLNLLDLLVDSAQIGAGDVVLEVGSGTGGLTRRLAQRAGWVVGVEIDPGFYRLAAQAIRGCSNVTLLHVDVLRTKNRFEPAVLEGLARAMNEAGAKDYLLVANLPYDVSASVIGNLLLEELVIRQMTVTVQHEMAERILAPPGSRDYGPLSALAARVGSARRVRSIPPQAFWPRPKVHSAIVQIDVDATRRADLAGLREWHAFVRDLFLHRRKNLRGSIRSIPRFAHRAGGLDEVLAAAGVPAEARAEQLSVSQLDAVFRALAAGGP